jgi:hypothetical protein
LRLRWPNARSGGATLRIRQGALQPPRDVGWVASLRESPNHGHPACSCGAHVADVCRGDSADGEERHLRVF